VEEIGVRHESWRLGTWASCEDPRSPSSSLFNLIYYFYFFLLFISYFYFF
jgi:hypothetical protein